MSDWYYSHDGQQKGPVPASELERLASGDEFDKDKDLVWREGMADWMPIASVPELQPAASPTAAAAGSTQQPAPQDATAQGMNPYATPNTGYQTVAPGGPLPSVKPVNFPLIAGTFIIGMIGFIAGYVMILPALSEARPDPGAMEVGGIILFVSLIPLIISVVLSCICVYRAWLLLQPHTSFSTPGKAVGFMFIPFFNLYWYFVAYWRWSQEWNRIVASRPDHPQAPRQNESMFLTYAILNASSIIPLLGSFTGLVSIAFFLVAIKGMASAVNYAAEQ